MEKLTREQAFQFNFECNFVDDSLIDSFDGGLDFESLKDERSDDTE